MTLFYSWKFETPVQIFEVIDMFARSRGMQGPQPPIIGTANFVLVGRIVQDEFVPFAQPLTFVMTRNPSGNYIAFRSVKQQGYRQHFCFDKSIYVIQISSPFYEERIEHLVLPRKIKDGPITVELFPNPTYPFPNYAQTGLAPTLLRGRLQDATGSGIAGMIVQYVTLNQGSWRVITSTSSTGAGRWLLILPETLPANNNDALPTLVAAPAAPPVMVGEQDQAVPSVILRFALNGVESNLLQVAIPAATKEAALKLANELPSPTLVYGKVKFATDQPSKKVNVTLPGDDTIGTSITRDGKWLLAIPSGGPGRQLVVRFATDDQEQMQTFDIVPNRVNILPNTITLSFD